MRKGFHPVTGFVLSTILASCYYYSGNLPAHADSTGKASTAANSVDSKSDSAAASVAPEPIYHPLDPLTKSELAETVSILKSAGKLDNNTSLVSLTLLEPAKDVVLNFKSGERIDRKAIAVLYSIDKNETREVITDLDNKKIALDTVRTGVQPMQLEEDTPVGIEILKNDPLWMKGLERRGIKDMNNIHMEMFVVGNPVNINNPQRDRLLRAYPFYRVVGDNSFGEPIEGLSALVNLTKKKCDVRDSKDIVPMAGITSNYFNPQYVGKLRAPCTPLVTTQPEGPSFTLDGHEVKWQKWRLRYELDSREGLVLHCVGYEDEGKVRPILHRIGVSEVSVPYGAPGHDWVWRSPIDEGEYGLGRLTTTLRPGHEVPGYAKTIDEPYANSVGTIKIKPGALAIWEQDGGILWEHHDDDADRTSTRRSRQLVIAHMFTLGNYDYFTQYLFNQDGSIDVKVTLNGDVLAQGVPNKECQTCAQEPDEEGKIIPKGIERYGTLVAPNIVGINHQHFFCFRMDFDVDGVKNNLYELNVRPIAESRGYAEQNTFTLERTLLRREQEAARDLNEVQNRCWKVVNQNARRYLGHAPGYLIEPATNAYPYSHPDSFNRKRAGFLQHHFWTTQYNQNEMYAAGDYPVSSVGGEGLPQWVGDASIDNEDIVCWYTVGITHTPRVEDWPVMPSASMGFKIMPEGFFKRNPSLDLAEAESPATSKHSKADKPKKTNSSRK
jgi:primary-amine oxidase